MEINLTSFEKLDTILKLFDFSNERGGLHIAGLMDSLGHNFNYKLMESILFKLENDGFLRSINQDTNLNGFMAEVKYYFLTIEGEVLQNQGGYVQLEKERLMQLNYLEEDNKRKKRNDRRLICATWAAGLAGFFLLAWDMYKTFCLREH